MESIGRELIYIWYYFDIQLRQIIVYWFLGMAIGSAVSVFAKDSIHRLMPGMTESRWGILGILPAAVLGILSPLCMYGTIPIAASFRRQGIREDWLASFMMTSILLNPQLMIYSAALGGRALVVRILSALVCGMTAGLLVRAYNMRGSAVPVVDSSKPVSDATPSVTKPPEVCIDAVPAVAEALEAAADAVPAAVELSEAAMCVEPAFAERAEVHIDTAPAFAEPSEVHIDAAPAFAEKREFFNFTGFEVPASRDTDPNLLMRYVKNFGRNVKSTGLYFLIGILLSALFQRYVPAELMTDLFGGNEAWGVLMAATIGVPLYVCGGGTIPLLQQWLADGMSLGSAAAFMITGPATKITNLGAVKIVLGMRHFICYLIFVMLFSLICGLAVNLMLGA